MPARTLPRQHFTTANLERLGFDTQFFPGYVNLEPHPHSLPVVLMSYFVRGRGQHIMGDDIYEEHGGALGITHYGQSHDIVTGPGGMDVMNVYLDLERFPLPDLPPDVRRVLPEILPLHPNFQHQLNRMVRVQFDDIERVTGIVFALDRELRTREPGFEAAATMYLKLLLMEACRQVMRLGWLPSESSDARPEPALEAVRRHLDGHYHEQHELATLAARAHMSRTHLCRAFKRYTGKSVFAYLLDRRLQAAMVALRTSQDKVLAVALDCGFRDLAYFNRQFKQRVGKTPTAYRAETRGPLPG